MGFWGGGATNRIGVGWSCDFLTKLSINSINNTFHINFTLIIFIILGEKNPGCSFCHLVDLLVIPSSTKQHNKMAICPFSPAFHKKNNGLPQAHNSS